MTSENKLKLQQLSKARWEQLKKDGQSTPHMSRCILAIRAHDPCRDTKCAHHAPHVATAACENVYACDRWGSAGEVFCCWDKKSSAANAPSVPAKFADSANLKPTLPVPALKTGDDAKVAARFKALFDQAEDAKLRVTAFGIYAHFIKLILLKKGQFGPWVSHLVGAEHYRTVRDHMLFAKSTLERAGHKNLKSLLSNWQSLPKCHSGEFLLLPDAEVPAEVKPLREKIFSLFAGKSKYQLCSEWKQVEEDESGHVKVKVGRLKKQGGASHAQRVAAAAAEKLADKVAKEEAIKGFQVWIKKNCVDTAEGIGLIVSDAALVSLNDWSKVAFDYTSRILAARGKA